MWRAEDEAEGQREWDRLFNAGWGGGREIEVPPQSKFGLGPGHSEDATDPNSLSSTAVPPLPSFERDAEGGCSPTRCNRLAVECHERGGDD